MHTCCRAKPTLKWTPRFANWLPMHTCTSAHAQKHPRTRAVSTCLKHMYTLFAQLLFINNYEDDSFLPWAVFVFFLLSSQSFWTFWIGRCAPLDSLRCVSTVPCHVMSAAWPYRILRFVCCVYVAFFYCEFCRFDWLCISHQKSFEHWLCCSGTMPHRILWCVCVFFFVLFFLFFENWLSLDGQWWFFCFLRWLCTNTNGALFFF